VALSDLESYHLDMSHLRFHPVVRVVNGVAFVFMTRCRRVPSVWFWIDIVTVYAKAQSKTEMNLQMIKTVKWFSINVLNDSSIVRFFF